MEELIYGRVVEIIGVNPNLSEFSGTYQSLSELIGVYRNSSEFIRTYRSLSEFIGVNLIGSD